MSIPRHTKFDRYDSVIGLANALRCQPEILYHSEKDLKQHKIPKKKLKNGYRLVWEVESKPLKQTLEIFQIEYFNFIRTKIEDFPLPCIHGFLNKRSIVTNSRPHTGKSLLLKADIKNFFDSITIERLDNHFLQMKLNKEISTVLSKMLTVNGTLPQGFCTSPLISNLIFLDLDRQLSILALKYDCQYTRYADDITFSSDKYVPTQSEISSILSKEGFELEQNKFRIKKNGQAFYVTGLSVADSQPRVAKKWKRELRQELYFIEKFGLNSHAGKKNYFTVQSCINKIVGKIHFFHSVEPKKAEKLKSKLDGLLKLEEKKVDYMSRGKPDPRNLVMYVDEYVKDNILFLCIVLIEDITLIENSLKQLHKKLYQDDFLPQKSGVLDKGILHWNDLSFDARRELVNIISGLPFRAFVAFTQFNKNYRKEYFTLFHELLKNRFRGLDGEKVNLQVEDNTMFNEQDLQEISDKIYFTSEKSSSRRPLNRPLVRVVSKQKALNLTLPDCLLGVLGDYLSSKEVYKGELTGFEAKFEQLRPKFRCIQFFRIILVTLLLLVKIHFTNLIFPNSKKCLKKEAKSDRGYVWGQSCITALLLS